MKTKKPFNMKLKNGFNIGGGWGKTNERGEGVLV